MQHPEQGGAGYPYGPPLTGMVPFLPPPASATVSVCNNIPSPSPSPMQPQPQPQTAGANFEQLPGSGGGGVSFRDDDDMPVDGGSGRSAGDAGAGGSGSRWPREETVALIRIRSEMAGAFRNAALKAPVWEEVSRKLAELGYRRSAKKCKEKFENVDKYYRRTKEGRAGRQDGKNYRFFEELEALHAAAPQQNQPMATATPILPDPRPLAMAPAHPAACLPDLSLSSNSESESDDESDEEEDQVDGGGRSNESMMALFEGMIKQITEKQDATQRLFLETLEKWEADRTAREEAWRRQELARISREREQHARERAAAAARDAALIAFLQRVGGELRAAHTNAGASSRRAGRLAAARDRSVGGGWPAREQRQHVTVAQGGGPRADRAANGEGRALPGHGGQRPAVGGHLCRHAKDRLQPELQAVQGEVGEHQQVLQEGEGEQQEAPRGLQDLPLLPPARRYLPQEAIRRDQRRRRLLYHCLRERCGRGQRLRLRAA